MKTIEELRTVLDFYPQEINSQVAHFAKHVKLDYEVFLPTMGINLQRDYVWNVEQKRELIWSILMKRNIPRMSMINTVDDVYQIIDGKQRLSTMIDFYNNKFSSSVELMFFFGTFYIVGTLVDQLCFSKAFVLGNSLLCNTIGNNIIVGRYCSVV